MSKIDKRLLNFVQDLGIERKDLIREKSEQVKGVGGGGSRSMSVSLLASLIAEGSTRG